MSDTINFGIDLGTTNSLIAKFVKGTVEVFKDPRSQGTEVLPSVVAFRNNRIIVGQAAKAFVEKDAKSTASRFKRTMGTTESFKIKSLDQSKTPTELSSLVLKELKTFVHTGEVPEAVVITIPASFDMLQSNATKKAGHAAGFKQVVLLQEPIAASLAYANSERNIDLKDSQWIVYDLGGGTFDVALVRIVGSELKIADHEGDNYLGGMDLDAMVVEKLIVPQLEERGTFTDLLAQMKSASGRHNRLWYSLLLKAEEAKIELSSRTSAEIDLGLGSVVDENGDTIDEALQITRSEFEALIKEKVDRTAEMLKKILTRNSLRPQDLRFVLMVGGSTYIPYVRMRIEELLGIRVNTGINPTNAVVVGAAYYAATKPVQLDQRSQNTLGHTSRVKIKVAHNPTSQEREEIFSAKVDGDVTGLFYRITRQDGAYDSGLKALAARVIEDLPLHENAYNLFDFKVFDVHGNRVPVDVGPIQIAQGKYGIAGQMVPHDLSLLLDSADASETKSDCIFPKNCVIPAKAKRTVEANRTITHGSGEEIRIIVVEGPSDNHYTVNRRQGQLVIRGNQLKRDLPLGTEIDLTFEMSESRDLTVTAYINPSGPEFTKVFVAQDRDVDSKGLLGELELLEQKIDTDKDTAISNEKYEDAKMLERLCGEVQKIHGAVARLAPDDATDEKFKLDNRKREVAQQFFQHTAPRRLQEVHAQYQEEKDEASEIVMESGNDIERRQLREIIAREPTFLNSHNPKKIEAATSELWQLRLQVLRRKPDFLIGFFRHLVERREVFNDQIQSRNLIEAGRRHVESESWERLDEVIGRLIHLMPQEEKSSPEMRGFTGIS
jgi:molecular chaperone DnaK